MPVETPKEQLYTAPQRTYLDAVRVVATNLVAIEHTRMLFRGQRGPYANLAVVLFFVLSGFLICGTARRRPVGQPQLLNYLVDRSARIFAPFVPALMLAAAANPLFALQHYGQPGINRGPLAFFGNLLLLNDYPVFQAASQFVDVDAYYVRSYNGAEPFWTIPIEFWTYVVFGVFFFVVVRSETANRAVVFLLLALSSPVFVWNAFAGGGHTLSLVWMMGAVFAHAWDGGRATLRQPSFLGALIVVFGATALCGRIAKARFDPYEFQTSVFIGLLFFGTFLLVRSARWRLHGASAAIHGLASYSYSLYLVHNIVLVIFAERLTDTFGEATPWLALVMSHVTAVLLYLGFERHHGAIAAWLKARLSSAPALQAGPVSSV